MSDVLTLSSDNSVGQDTYIGSGAFVNSNYSSSTYIKSMYDTYSRTWRGLIIFDLSSYIGQGYTFSSAILSLTQHNDTGTNTVDLHRITSSWTYDTVTWNTQPTYNASIIDTVTGGTNNQAYDFDITSLIQDICDGTYTNYGFLLKGDTESSTSGVEWYSSNHGTTSYRPYLTLDYSIDISCELTKTDISINTTDIESRIPITAITSLGSLTININTTNVVISVGITRDTTKTNIDIGTSSITLSVGNNMITNDAGISVNITYITLSIGADNSLVKSDISIGISDISLIVENILLTTKSNIDINTTNISANESVTLRTIISNININTTTIVSNTGLILLLSKSNIDINTTNIVNAVLVSHILQLSNMYINAIEGIEVIHEERTPIITFYSSPGINIFYSNPIIKKFYA
jgi:hypothetical protein